MCDATAKITCKSQRCEVTVDLAPVILGVLLAMTVGASLLYSRQIRRAQKEYEKARGLVEDIVLSFNRQLKRESDKFDSMVYKVDESASLADRSFRKVEAVEKKVAPLENQLNSISQTATQNTTEHTNLLSSLINIEGKIKDIEANQETLKTKIAGFEEQIQKLTIAPQPEAKMEIPIPVIPIKRDKALATLTETEIAVLEMLSKEGAKTAPEIKERVKLSREHTARLMKKLYEEGYLERETGKIPFRYNVKKEMAELLEKAAPKPPA